MNIYVMDRFDRCNFRNQFNVDIEDVAEWLLKNAPQVFVCEECEYMKEVLEEWKQEIKLMKEQYEK